MRKVVPPQIKFIYEDSKQSEENLRIIYNRIFNVAAKNLREKRKTPLTLKKK